MGETGKASAGVINPFALVEARLGQRIDWQRIADPKRFVSTVLGFPYEKLFDPKHGSPLYAHAKLHKEGKPRTAHDAQELHARLLAQDEHALAAGAWRRVGPAWKDPGTFFLSSPDFQAPVQGAIPNCHFISAMAALAWSNPAAFVHNLRPSRANDVIQPGGTLARIAFHDGTGAAPTNVEVTEKVPLNEPGDNYIYGRSGHAGETWPAVYEKAWVKWITHASGDHPDYSLVTGGDPVWDLVTLTGLTAHYQGTSTQTGDDIWDAVRSHCRGSWTFDPLVACTYATDADGPPGINYSSAGLVAWHCYAILGWQYANNKKYIVVRNPWGYHEGTLNVDVGPWTSFDQFEGGLVVGTLNLPDHGVFALEANTFQQYFASYGWVS